MTDSESMENTAQMLYEKQEFSAAAEHFTSAAYTTLGSSLIGASVQSLGAGLYYLLFASLSFRRAGESDRATNRGKQGVLIATDARDSCFTDPQDKGILTEFVADFETVGKVGSPSQSYRRAAQYYAESDVAYTTSRNSDPLDSRLYQFFEHVLQESDRELPEWFQPRYAYTTRVNFKSEEMNAILAYLEK